MEAIPKQEQNQATRGWRWVANLAALLGCAATTGSTAAMAQAAGDGRRVQVERQADLPELQRREDAARAEHRRAVLRHFGVASGAASAPAPGTQSWGDRRGDDGIHGVPVTGRQAGVDR